LKLVLNNEVAKRNQEEQQMRAQQQAKLNASQIVPPMSPSPTPSPVPPLYRSQGEFPNPPFSSANQNPPSFGGPPGPYGAPMTNSQHPSPAHLAMPPMYGGGDPRMRPPFGAPPSHFESGDMMGMGKDALDKESPGQSPIDSRSMAMRQHVPSPLPMHS